MNELNSFENDFHTQAQTINSWDSLLGHNNQQLNEMEGIVSRLENHHKNIDHQLDYVISQQNDLEKILNQIEINSGDIGGSCNAQRQHTYSMIETIDNDLDKVTLDLKVS